MEQNELLLEEQLENMEEPMEAHTTITQGDDVIMETTQELYEVEEKGFWKQNQTTILTATGTTIAGFTGGFFAGKFAAKKENEKFMNEVKKQITLFGAKLNGMDEVEWEGVKIPTALHEFDNANDVKAIIIQEYLKDEKVSAKKKAEWNALVIELINLGELARAKQIMTEKEIVQDVKEDDAN